MNRGESTYRPELPMSELIDTIRRLLESQRVAERLLCRYLADLSDRVDARGVDTGGGYADIYQAARCLFGMGVRRTTLHLRAETWALVQRAIEGARRAAEGDALLSEADALDAVARDALARQAAGETNALRKTVVLYECVSCRRTELETGAGPIEIGDAAAAVLGCGAPVRDLRTEGRIERRGGPLPSAVARAVRLRDRDRCRVPGCSRRRYVHVHHIDERSQGGVHSRRNCLCLCDTHHRMLHEGKLSITGDAEGAIEFRHADGRPIADPLAAPDVTHLGLSGEDGARLIALLGRRGCWDVDSLCDATGMGIGALAGVMLTFELAGRVQRDYMGRYALVGGRSAPALPS